MRKPVFCICENKGADQLHGQLTSGFLLAAYLIQFFYYIQCSEIQENIDEL